MTNDVINHPDYYKSDSGKFEAIDYIEAYDLNFNLGNVIKYVTRARRKTQDSVPDLEKAKWYIEREIQRLVSKEPERWTTGQ